MKCLFTFLTILPLAFPTAADEYRTWTDNTGKYKVTGRLDAIKDGKALLSTKDGKQLAVPAAKLSADDRKLILDMKRAQHQNWSVKTVGFRPAVIDDTGASGGTDKNGRPFFQTTHNYHTTTQRFYYRMPFQGNLLSVEGRQATFSIRIFKDGRQIGTITETYNVGNLGYSDQDFIKEYRQLTK